MTKKKDAELKALQIIDTDREPLNGMNAITLLLQLNKYRVAKPLREK